MKKILFATDFSAASLNAFSYCVSLASELGADIHVYHVYKTEQPIPESYLVHSTPDRWPEIDQRLQDFVRSANPANSFSLSISADHGIASDCIIKEALRVAADLIMCGMNHASLDLRRIFGSTATAIAHKSTLPLMVIPYNAQFKPLQHVALACDTDPYTRPSTVSLLATLIEKFAAKLSVVFITPDEAAARYEMHFHKLPFMAALKEVNPVFEFSQGQNITQSLLRFTSEQKIDMLAVIAHKHSIFDRLVVESVTRNLAFHTDIPMLVLAQKIIADSNSDHGANSKTETSKFTS